MFCIYDVKNPPKNMDFLKSFSVNNNRGPDSTILINESSQNISRINPELLKCNLSKKEIAQYKQYAFVSGFHRLAINDLSPNGAQPFEDPIMFQLSNFPELRNRPKRTLLCNGEIYNYNELKKTEDFNKKDLQSDCDVEIILPLYIKYGLEETLRKINGDYSFVLTENLNTYILRDTNIYVVRDIFGTKPLYMVKNLNKSFYFFTSELKAVPFDFLKDPNYLIQEVPAGTYWSFQNSIINNNNNEFIRYSDWNYYNDIKKCDIEETDPDTLSSVYSNIRNLLTNSVINRFSLSNKPVGVLLSGGFDSSIILSILLKYLKSINHDFNANPIHTFTIGDKNNTDVQNSLKIVDYFQKKYDISLNQHIIGVHNSNYDNSFLNIIDDIIKKIETIDPETIRDSIPFYYLFDYIKTHTNVKVLLSGEGLDELCGNNKLFKSTDENFQKSSVKLIKYMNKFNLLKIDKLSGYYGLEIRHPFLDRDFVEYILKIHPKLKRPQIYNYSRKTIEKYIIRKAFDTEIDGIKYLNSEVLWRSLQSSQKCFKFISNDYTNLFNVKISDQEFNNYLIKCNNDPDYFKLIPKNKEDMYYMMTFENIYPKTLSIFLKFKNDLIK